MASTQLKNGLTIPEKQRDTSNLVRSFVRYEHKQCTLN
uniref:Uncharacterized protein n=1 Tax=Arundo donax TaxID=35708 RepID=A0A0A9FN11_ARUDO